MITAVHVGRAGGDEDELGAPGGVAVAFEVERGVGFVARRKDLAGLAVHATIVGLGLEEGSDDLAVGMDHPAEVGMGPRAGTVGVEEPERAGLFGGEFAVRVGERGEDGRVGEVAVAGVEVVVATHRPHREVQVGPVREPLPDSGADQVPDDGVREFGFDASGAAVDADQCFVEHPHVGRIVTRSTTSLRLLGDQAGELVDRRVGEQRLDTLERGDAATTSPHRERSSFAQSQPMRRAARSRLRTPSACATASI